MYNGRFKNNLAHAEKSRTPIYFNQKLDHFNRNDTHYFSQKYLEVIQLF
jgi:hypothetical protein